MLASGGAIPCAAFIRLIVSTCSSLLLATGADYLRIEFRLVGMSGDNGPMDIIQDSYKKYLYENHFARGNLFMAGGSDGPAAYYQLQSLALSDSGQHISGSTESDLRRLLHYNDSLPNIRDLSPQNLSSLAIDLTDILKVILTPDHTDYWKFTHSVLGEYQDDLDIGDGFLEAHEVLTRVAISSRLAYNESYPSGNSSFPERGWNRDANLDQIVDRLEVLAAFMSFPLLEHVVKWACSDDIKLDGTVRDGRSIVDYHGKSHEEHCYRLGFLLYHLETETANERLACNMVDIRDMIGDFYDCPGDRVYGLIDSQRNRITHGQNTAVAEYGTVLNLISLILWHEISRIV